MTDFEKLGAFYLGRVWNAERRQVTDEALLYDAKDLTTHGVVVGMTGSGKTGLAVGMLEEAAIDGVPALVIDPKGDMGNLMLSFPELRAADFEPWIDPSEAGRSGQTVSQYSETVAERWRQGLADWGQDAERIRRYRESVEVSIYTPGSTAGLPLTVLKSFAAPTEPVRSDPDLMRERVDAAVSGLLALLGISADPIRSREHILLANLFDGAWRAGEDLDIERLIGQIQSPPFEKLGVLDIESFFPASQRTKLAMQLNSLLASPSFGAWLEGEPLEIERLLYTPEGRPRIAILSLSHLSETERMFIVTLVLNEVVAWMRTQSGTSSLRALVYMDEIFGYFPPSANPPSKQPMLTLLKQARAFGVGILLATQNPVDLDYKGLSNCGTWFIGRLQTERDKDRLLEGLISASTLSEATLDRRQLSETIGSLDKRVFLMNNVHEDGPELFQTRWVLCYLRGPLVRDQIAVLMEDQKAASRARREERINDARALQEKTAPAQATETASRRPGLPPGVEYCYLSPEREVGEGQRLVYRPMLEGRAELHFKRASAKVDEWVEVLVVAPIVEGSRSLGWDDARELPADSELRKRGLSSSEYSSLPTVATRAKAWQSVPSKLSSQLYRSRTLKLFHHPEMKLYSRVGESESDFRRRVKQEADEQRDRDVEALRTRYAASLKTLAGKIERAETRIEREKSQFRDRSLQTVISLGTTVMGALLNRKVGTGTVSRAGTAVKGLSRGAKEKDDVDRAEESLERLVEEKAELEKRFEADKTAIQQQLDASRLEIETLTLRPTKSDTVVTETRLVWTPWSIDEDESAVALWNQGVPLSDASD